MKWEVKQAGNGISRRPAQSLKRTTVFQGVKESSRKSHSTEKIRRSPLGPKRLFFLTRTETKTFFAVSSSKTSKRDFFCAIETFLKIVAQCQKGNHLSLESFLLSKIIKKQRNQKNYLRN